MNRKFQIPNRKQTIAGLQRLSLALVLGSASLLWGVTKGPDAGNYTATDGTVYSYINLAAGSGAASVLGSSDDAVALLNLPFPFTFYGKSYNLICASSNGALYFVTSAGQCAAANDFANTDLTATATPGDLPALLPYWTDLTFQNPGAGAVFYAVQGAPGSRRFIVQWSRAYPAASANLIDFEAVLYEGSNNILFQYQTVDLGNADPSSKGALSTIGIRDAAGNTNGRQIEWSFNAGVAPNSSAILFTPPASGQTSVNTINTNPSGLTVVVDGVSYISPKVLSWQPNSNHTLSVTTPQTGSGVRNLLTSWSTGETTPQITVTATAAGGAITANFQTQYQLTTATNPAAGGSITAGGWFNAGNSVAVSAAANTGYAFSFFSGDLSGSTTPQNVAMTAPRNVVANFQSTANPILTAAVSGKADGAVTGQRVWTIRLNNTGPATASNAQISAVTLTQSSGTPCSPTATLVSALPVSVGTIATASNATGQITINFSGCADATDRFAAKVNFSANGGAYTGSTTISNQAK